MSLNQRECELIKEDGAKCHSFAGKNSQFCFMHDPLTAERRLEAQQKGQNAPKRGKTELADKSKWREMTRVELRRLLSEVVLRITEDRITNLNMVRSLGYACNILLNCYSATEAEELKKRIKQLEELILPS